MTACNGVIDLATPRGSERRRGYQPPWYTVYKYTCPKCGTDCTVRAGAFYGKRPTPGRGAILCHAPIGG